MTEGARSRTGLWTKEDEGYLRWAYSQGLSLGRAAKHLGRTVDATKQKAPDWTWIILASAATRYLQGWRHSREGNPPRLALLPKTSFLPFSLGDCGRTIAESARKGGRSLLTSAGYWRTLQSWDFAHSSKVCHPTSG